ncbi:septum formation initiator family protein [bacterium]|nr:septum formation initiator family protein [bacterium]
MNKKDDLKYLRVTRDNKEKLKQNIRRILYIGICLIILYLLLLGENGLIAVTKYHKLKKELQGELEAKRAEEDSLRIEIEKLQSDSTYIEKIAREDYGLIRDNEKILHFKDSNEREPGQKD